ncbi:site-specific integrase [Candidatus Pacearchaeota archaeon]|nr:site-specific integrase [Candidatus Pacearchaeota archaeon]
MEKVEGHVGVYRRTAASGISTLYVSYKLNHKKTWKVIGPEPLYTPAMAKDVRDKCVTDAKQLPTVSPAERTLTLDQAFHKFATTYADMQLISGVPHLRNSYEKHLRPAWGTLDLSLITPAMINAQKIQWLKVLAPTAVNQIISLLSRVYSAVGTKFLGLYPGTNPVTMVKRLAVDDTRLRFLSKQESLHLMGTLQKINLQTYRICAFCLYAGLRKMEAITIRGANIDLNNNILIIKTKDKKMGRMASLPILPELRSIIEDMYAEKYYAPNERLFPADKFNYKAFSKAINTCKLNDNIDWEDPDLQGDRFKVVLHTLRHSFASHLVADGVPMETVRRLMRHTSIATTEIYAKVNDQQLCEAINILSDSWKEANDSQET